jgi:hypothetical protein
MRLTLQLREHSVHVIGAALIDAAHASGDDLFIGDLLQELRRVILALALRGLRRRADRMRAADMFSGVIAEIRRSTFRIVPVDASRFYPWRERRTG